MLRPTRPSVNQWLQRRRPYHLMLLYRDFYRVFERFTQIYRLYADNGEVSYAALEELVGTESDKGRLWRLKDRCHLLWRQEDNRSLEGCLLDLVLGALFHECMKLKEDIYLRERYRPQLESYMLPPAAGERDVGRPASRLLRGFEWNRFLLRSGRESGSEMESLAFLFGQANYLLRLLLADETGNELLLRYLVEHEERVILCWHETLDELFDDLFDGAPERGYCAAARSYQAGHWHEQARQTFDRALRLNPACHEALQQVHRLAVMGRLAADSGNSPTS